MKEILPQHIYEALEATVNLNKLYEIRVREGKSVIVNENSHFHTLCFTKQNGLDFDEVVATKKDVEHILFEACEHSLYSYENQIKQGFVTTKSGIRIGICGEIVTNANGGVISIKNISSLVIRIPHEVKNCATTALNVMFEHRALKNTLIIAPPGAGKTTILRDIARGIGKYVPELNVLICDERGEIASVCGGVATLDVGNADVLSFASKEYVFREGVRALRPDVLICDEIISESDALSCERLASQGVKLIASVHGKSQYDLMQKPAFSKLISNKVFERYIILSTRCGNGTYECILDENMNMIY